MGADPMMKNLTIAILYAALGAAAYAGEEPAAKEPAAEKPARRSRQTALYDTVTALPDPGSAPWQVQEDAWTRIPKDETPKEFKGDAVLSNGMLAAVVRKDGAGVDLYARADEAWNHRARLAPLKGDGTTTFEGARVTSNDGVAVSLEVKQAGDGEKVVFSMTPAAPMLRATAGEKAEGLRISAPCRWGILPDFFTGDFLVDARRMKAERTEIPSDQLFLQLLADGNAILAAIWSSNERDISVSFAGEGEERRLAATDICYGAKGSIWTGVLEKQGIWYHRVLAKGEDTKGGPMDWQVPFAAKWKGDFVRPDGLVDSHLYNPWIQPDKKTKKLTAALPKIRKRRGEPSYEGPMVVYPIRRAEETPLDRMLLDDLMRLSLGSGPCGYILDVSGRTSTGKGIFTCSYDWTIPRMLHESKEEAGFLKDERVFVRTMHRDVLVFMNHIQDRIGAYAQFRKELLAALEEQEKKTPELAGYVGALKAQVGKLPNKRPEGDKKVVPLIEKIERGIAVDTPENIALAKGSARPIPPTAEHQDVQLANCRKAVKELRVMAVAEMVKDTKTAENPAADVIVKMIREKTHEILRNPAHHEGSESW